MGSSADTDATDELMIPEERQDEPTLTPLRPAIQPEPETSTNVWRSKYTQPQSESSGSTLVGATLTGDTLQMLRGVVNEQKNSRTPARDRALPARSTVKSAAPWNSPPVKSAARRPGSAHAAAGTGR